MPFKLKSKRRAKKNIRRKAFLKLRPLSHILRGVILKSTKTKKKNLNILNITWKSFEFF